jgi:uncharacterized protein YndB with AHSA1/START domain
MSEERQVVEKVVVETTEALAFEALTRASELREWFSDEAWTEVRGGGRYEVRWNQGYRAEGRFTQVDAPHRAALTWRGTGEPGETELEFGVQPAGAAVEVTVVHRGFGPGPEWDAALDQARQGWATGLENLKSVLEAAVDLRVARRPFLGIYLGDLDAARAEREGLATGRGVYVEGTVEGSGARAAGLARGDVLVSIAGEETPGNEELGAVLTAHRAGDVVELGIYRGQERLSVPVTLGQRQLPPLPGSAVELADWVASQAAEPSAELKAALEGVGEDEAGQSPAAGEWSVKQVLAHLSLTQRDGHFVLAAYALNGWLGGGDDGPDAYPGRLTAVLAVAPTLPELLERLALDEAETVAMLRELPPEAVAHKARFRRLAGIVGIHSYHTRQHIAQIQAAIETVRGG